MSGGQCDEPVTATVFVCKSGPSRYVEEADGRAVLGPARCSTLTIRMGPRGVQLCAGIHYYSALHSPAQHMPDALSDLGLDS